MRLRDIFIEFGDRVQFIGIYIREAHPVDGWSFDKPPMRWLIKAYAPWASTDILDPKTLEERRAAAGRCELTLHYKYPTVVDEIDDRVSEAYAAKPTRLYLVGTDGRVAYAGGLGPIGFKPVAFRSAIAAYLKK
ncbi:MAG: hypothetical protein GY847_11965 [Proteobacteria bacterium]|nr:hypothetical protein [Pseudomonadota bacterium]